MLRERTGRVSCSVVIHDYRVPSWGVNTYESLLLKRLHRHTCIALTTLESVKLHTSYGFFSMSCKSYPQKAIWESKHGAWAWWCIRAVPALRVGISCEYKQTACPLLGYSIFEGNPIHFLCVRILVSAQQSLPMCCY